MHLATRAKLLLYSINHSSASLAFILRHRNEPRSVSGLFFDVLNEWGFERCFAFI
jgi:Coproporphyrinogen III oxidase